MLIRACMLNRLNAVIQFFYLETTEDRRSQEYIGFNRFSPLPLRYLWIIMELKDHYTA